MINVNNSFCLNVGESVLEKTRMGDIRKVREYSVVWMKGLGKASINVPYDWKREGVYPVRKPGVTREGVELWETHVFKWN